MVRIEVKNGRRAASTRQCIEFHQPVLPKYIAAASGNQEWCDSGVVAGEIKASIFYKAAFSNYSFSDWQGELPTPILVQSMVLAEARRTLVLDEGVEWRRSSSV